MLKFAVFATLGAGLLHCGPAMPVKAVLTSCTDKTPIASAQFDRMGTITRSAADGSWQSDSIGKGSFPVEVFKTGYKKQEFDLKPGEQGNAICLQPE